LNRDQGHTDLTKYSRQCAHHLGIKNEKNFEPLMNIKIKEAMTKDLLTVAPYIPLHTVIKKLQETRHSCVLVQKFNKLLGIFTERDVVNVLAQFPYHSPNELGAIETFMSQELHTITEFEDIETARTLMKKKKVRQLPVLSLKNEVVGIITQGDIVKADTLLLQENANILEQQVEQRTRQLAIANARLTRLSLMDSLTELGNRRSMDEDIKQIHAIYERTNRPYAITLVDIDFFKNYNDNYGHPSGDKVIQNVAEYLRNSCRLTDKVYRYGGEEFLILMPDTDTSGLQCAVNRLVTGFSNLNIPHQYSPFKSVTISAGCCSVQSGAHENWQDIITTADDLLYQAKNAGRNQAHFQPHSTSFRAVESATIYTLPAN